MSVEFCYAHAATRLRGHESANLRADSFARVQAEPLLRVLGLPSDMEGHTLPESVRTCSENEFPDFVILREPNSAALLSCALQPALSAVIPIVDATRQPGCEINRRRSDISISLAHRQSINFAKIMLAPMISRLHELPADLMESHDPHLWLLARLFVRNRSLKPRRDVAVKNIIVYDDESAVPQCLEIAEGLVQSGLLERRFYDALTTCPHCESARLIAREHCAACGSTHVIEQPVLHHMRCAYQGPEEDFRRSPDGDLICPKCLQRLKQFSLDYDRPGWLYLCRSCSHVSGDLAIGFLCLDCEVEVPAAHIATRTAFDYVLTDAGRACLLSGRDVAAAPTAFRCIADRVYAFMRRQAAMGQDYCILAMRLREPAGTPVAGRAWQQSLAFFGSLLRECFTLGTEIIEARSAFFALLAGDNKAEVERELPEIRRRLQRHMTLAPEVEYSVYGPEEFLAFVSLMRAEQ